MRKIYILFILVGLLAFTGVGWGQTTIVNFDFNSGASDAALTPALASGITSTFSSTEAFITYAGIASGGNAFTVNPTGGNARGMANSSGTNTKYHTFLTSGANLNLYKSLKVYFQAQRSGTGAQLLTVQYSLNGGGFTDFPSNTMAPGNGSFAEGIFTLPGAVDNPVTSIEIRIFASGASGSGTLRMDNLQLQGTLPVVDGDGSAVLSNVTGTPVNLNNTKIFPSNRLGQSVKLLVTGTTGGTLTSVSVTIPLQWVWDGTSVSTPGDLASLTGLSVTGDGSSTPYTITYTGSITNTQIASITIQNLRSSNPTALTDNGNYTFVVKTAKAAGTLTAIASSPLAYVIVPLSHVRNQSGGVPVLLNNYVATFGVATVANGVFSTSQLQSYIQDGNYGCNIFLSGAPPTITEGESYIVLGQVQQYNGNSEIAPASAANIIDNGAEFGMPGYQVVSIPDLLANPENYEGLYIAVQGLSLFTGTWPSTAAPATLVFQDGSANSLTVYLYSTTDMHSNSQPTWPGDIAGIFAQYGTPSSYELVPRHFALDFGANNTFPVELTSFTSSVKGTSVMLKWNTATEVQNNGFAVERSANKSEWTKLGFVAGSGNSNSVKNYSFTDNSVTVSGKYSYRLKQVDKDGSYKYSNTTEVNFGAPSVFSLNQNYPNPFNPSTIIAYSIPNASNVKLMVFNAIGQVVKVLEDGYKEAGNYNISFNASNLPSGLYFYKIEAGQFSQTRKMMLVK